MGAQSGCGMEKSVQKGNSTTNNMEVKKYKAHSRGNNLERYSWKMGKR